MKYKKFADLEFKPHVCVPGGIHATMEFSNGFGVSVVQGPTQKSGLYGNAETGTYELAILIHGSLLDGSVLDEAIHGYLSPADVSAQMVTLQKQESI